MSAGPAPLWLGADAGAAPAGWRRWLDGGVDDPGLWTLLAGLPGAAARGAALDTIDRLLQPVRPGGPALGAWAFAMPVILVTAGPPGTCLEGHLADRERLLACLREAGALGPSPAVGIAPVLCAPDWPDRALLQALDRCCRALEQGGAPQVPDLPAAPLSLGDGAQAAHLRLLVGVSLVPAAAPSILETAAEPGRWAAALGRELARQLAAPGVTLLAMPRPPQPVLRAAAAGAALCEEVALQLFLSEALRSFRAATGEPLVRVQAVEDGIGIWLDNPFDRGQVRYHCRRLHPAEDFRTAVDAILALLEDCRVEQPELRPGLAPRPPAA